MPPGQSQKEFTVNQAHALLDALLHLVVEGVSDSPPANPASGECWFVGLTPTEAWATQAGMIATYQAGVWLFVEPVEGMRAFDRSASQIARFSNGAWVYASAIGSPTGGAIIDVEARTAIDAIVAALVDCGLVPAT